MNNTKSKSHWIIDVNDESFAAEVIERSLELPVVVDFWAAWCGPCRMLGPVLEKLAIEYDGKFLLAKANTDEAPQAAGQFAVQSIPAVYGLRGGEVVDFFLGALPEPQIREWLDRLLPSAAEQLVAEADRLGDSNVAAAEEKYRQAVAADAHLVAAKIALARLLEQQDRSDEAAEIIEQLEQRGFLEPEAEKIKASLHLRAHAATSGGVTACRDAVARHPEDLQLQLQLAEALAGHEEYEEALQICLQLVQTDRERFGERARQTMVDIFRLLPDDSDLTRTYRRKLSAALF